MTQLHRSGYQVFVIVSFLMTQLTLQMEELQFAPQTQHWNRSHKKKPSGRGFSG